MTSEKKMCFLTWAAVSFPGREIERPAFKDLQKVDIAGKKNVACRKAMRAAR